MCAKNSKNTFKLVIQEDCRSIFSGHGVVLTVLDRDTASYKRPLLSDTMSAAMSVRGQTVCPQHGLFYRQRVLRYKVCSVASHVANRLVCIYPVHSYFLFYFLVSCESIFACAYACTVCVQYQFYFVFFSCVQFCVVLHTVLSVLQK